MVKKKESIELREKESCKNNNAFVNICNISIGSVAQLVRAGDS